LWRLRFTQLIVNLWRVERRRKFKGNLPSHSKVEFPFVVSYDIENGKIVHHWLMADSMTLMEQLGVMNVNA